MYRPTGYLKKGNFQFLGRGVGFGRPTAKNLVFTVFCKKVEIMEKIFRKVECFPVFQFWEKVLSQNILKVRVCATLIPTFVEFPVFGEETPQYCAQVC